MEREEICQAMAKKYIQGVGRFISPLAIESITRLYSQILPAIFQQQKGMRLLKIPCEEMLVVLKFHRIGVEAAKNYRPDGTWSYLKEEDTILRSVTPYQEIKATVSLHIFSQKKPDLLEEPSLQESLLSLSPFSFDAPFREIQKRKKKTIHVLKNSSAIRIATHQEEKEDEDEYIRKLNFLKRQHFRIPSIFEELQTQYDKTTQMCELTPEEKKDFPFLVEEHFNFHMPFFLAPSQRGGPWLEPEKICPFDDMHDFLIQGVSRILVSENEPCFNRAFIQWKKLGAKRCLVGEFRALDPKKYRSSSTLYAFFYESQKYQPPRLLMRLPWSQTLISLSELIRALGEKDDFLHQVSAEHLFCARVLHSLSCRMSKQSQSQSPIKLDPCSQEERLSILSTLYSKKTPFTLKEAILLFRSCFPSEEEVWKCIETHEQEETCGKEHCCCFCVCQYSVTEEQALLKIFQDQKQKQKEEEAEGEDSALCGSFLKQKQTLNQARSFLKYEVFPQVESNQKLNSLVEFVVDMWMVFTNQAPETLKDSVLLKRISPPGKTLALHLRQTLRDRQRTWTNSIEKKVKQNISFGLRELFVNEFISFKLQNAHVTGETQIRKWTNSVAKMSQQLRVVTRLNPQSKEKHARDVQDHEGLFDPWYSPDGLVLNTTQCFEYSEEPDDHFLIQWIQTHGHLQFFDLQNQNNVATLSAFLGHPSSSFAFSQPQKCALVLLNGGTPLGWSLAPKWFIRQIRNLRRRGFVPETLSIEQHGSTVFIETDAGRAMKQVIYVPLFRKFLSVYGPQVLLQMSDQDFRRCGLWEVIDNNEQGVLLVSPFDQDQQKYSLIHPSFIQSLSTSLIPFAAHDMASRVANQSGMIQQATSFATSHYRSHVHGGESVFVPLILEKPLIGTASLNWWNLSEQPLGVNVRSVITCWKGWNQDDCLLNATHANELGYMASFAYATASCEEASSNRFSLDRIHSEKERTKTKTNTNTEYFANVSGVDMKKANSSCVDSDGLTEPGTYINGSSDVWVSKIFVSSDSTHSFYDRSQLGSMKHSGQVASVLLTSNSQGQRITKVRFCKYQNCKEGDKSTSAHGQKGVVSKSIERFAFIHDEQGFTPTSCISPMAFPSRMTIGQLVEALCSRAALKSFQDIDATLKSELYWMAQQDRSIYEQENSMFEILPEFNKEELVVPEHTPATQKKKRIHQVLKGVLKALGYEHTGYSTMYDSITGLMLGHPHHQEGDGLLNVNHVFSFALDRKSSTKEHAFTQGIKDPLTGQPVEGQAYRFGEMERDILIGHDAAHTLQDRLFLNSSMARIFICSGCGWPAVANHKDKLFYCQKCRFAFKIYQVSLSKAFSTLLDLLPMLGTFPRIRLSPLT